MLNAIYELPYVGAKDLWRKNACSNHCGSWRCGFLITKICYDRYYVKGRKTMRVETERLYLYPISNDEMRCLIEKETGIEMKQAYTEMLEGCLMEPDNRIWYAVWNMELKNVSGTIVGDFCFKGLGKDGVVEIGYGLREEFRHQGYMVETVKVITEWALSMEGVCAVEAETDPENVASQNVLRRAGFVKNGVIGEEGPRFVYRRKENEQQ